MSIRIKQAIYDYGNTDQYGDPEHNVTISAQADITNDEDRNIEYIESSLILCDKDGLPVAQYNHNKERFLPPSESTSFSIGFHVDEELLEGQYDEELLKEKYNDAKLKLVVIPHTSYYAKIPSIPLADSSFTVTGTEEKINVDNLVTIEAVSVYHRSAGDENSKTCDVIVNCLITNLTDSYINKCVVKVNLFDSAERELAENMVEKPILPQAKAMIELELYDFSLYRLKNSRIQPELKIDMPLPPMMSESTLTLAKYNYIIEVKSSEGEDIQFAIPTQEAWDFAFARENNHYLEDLFHEKCETIASYYGPMNYAFFIYSKSGGEKLHLPNPNKTLKFERIKEPNWKKVAKQNYLRHYDDEDFDFISITLYDYFSVYQDFIWFRGNLILSEPFDLDKLKLKIFTNSFGELASIEYDDQQIYVKDEYEYEDRDRIERKRPELPSYTIDYLTEEYEEDEDGNLGRMIELRVSDHEEYEEYDEEGDHEEYEEYEDDD